MARAAVDRVIDILFILVLSANIAWAGEAAPAASDPGLEKRVNAISEELRCLVCQNQSLADSHADLAIDLKNQVREKLKQGMSERQIVDYMVERYGDFVLYRPPLKATTFLLWFGPFLLLGAGLVGLFVRLARRGRSAPEALSESERARATALLDVENEAGPR
ncbi:MAG: cytochrome c-type biosis protein CcmH [Betaproteobacteria bacterium]|nr:cytochrome c-type biosis protein CcmH [Betaproteobacteria bacterium]